MKHSYYPLIRPVQQKHKHHSYLLLRLLPQEQEHSYYPLIRLLTIETKTSFINTLYSGCMLPQKHEHSYYPVIKLLPQKQNHLSYLLLPLLPWKQERHFYPLLSVTIETRTSFPQAVAQSAVKCFNQLSTSLISSVINTKYFSFISVQICHTYSQCIYQRQLWICFS